MTSLELIKNALASGEPEYCIRLTPPQTNDIPNFRVGRGAYLFVIDVSGSMNAAAQVTTDDGDKVNHGWSQLDIAKHSTNTFVSSLEDGDFVSIITYSDGANVLQDWACIGSMIDAPDGTQRDARTLVIEKIHSMRPERSTNLMAGITTGFEQFKKFPTIDGMAGLDVSQYALSLIITTDGMPSSQWHPARGRDGYGPLVKTLSAALANEIGTAAVPVVTTIGIGFQLDSELLNKFSETFLHMPDPGQIGPFIVNLLATVRSTARLPEPSARAANRVTLEISPASAIATPLVGYRARTDEQAGVLRVPLGTVLYDQPRHVILRPRGDVPFQVSLKLNGEPDAVLSVSTDNAIAADATLASLCGVQAMRLAACDALDKAVAATGGAAERAAPLLACIGELRASPQAGESAVANLAASLEKEAVLGAEDVNFNRWGGHYFRTLPCMLRAERRSNFRDECMQHFGHDAQGREALFETQSNEAEMKFATLAPPEPSLLRPPPALGAGAGAAAAPPPPRVAIAMPDEFMRGGGCFGPDATVTVVHADGSASPVAMRHVRAGDVLAGEGGRLSTVRCVVLSACAGGQAVLTRLPNGLELTEWHPIREPNGRWRFPLMLGERVLRRTPYVYNLVLQPGHPTVLVGGVACAALGHGLTAAVVAHPYWGTRAVLDDLMSKEGWEAGRVVLSATAAAAHH